MRLLAFYMHQVGDPSMVQAFLDGRDIHQETAAAIFNKEVEDVTELERQAAKTFNYATVYGQGVKKAAITLTEQLETPISEEMGKEMREKMLDQWPGIKLLSNPGYKWKRELKGAIESRLSDRGYITTLHGRHLHPEYEHKALNALIQGTAADIMREALQKVHTWLRSNSLVSHIVNVVHDEIVLDVVKKEIVNLVRHVPGLMNNVTVSKVIPVEVSVEFSETSWAEKVEYVG